MHGRNNVVKFTSDCLNCFPWVCAFHWSSLNYTTVIMPFSLSAAFNGTRQENWPQQILISPTKSYLTKRSGILMRMCHTARCFHVKGQKPKTLQSPGLILNNVVQIMQWSSSKWNWCLGSVLESACCLGGIYRKALCYNKPVWVWGLR